MKTALIVSYHFLRTEDMATEKEAKKKSTTLVSSDRYMKQQKTDAYAELIVAALKSAELYKPEKEPAIYMLATLLELYQKTILQCQHFVLNIPKDPCRHREKRADGRGQHENQHTDARESVSGYESKLRQRHTEIFAAVRAIRCHGTRQRRRPREQGRTREQPTGSTTPYH